LSEALATFNPVEIWLWVVLRACCVCESDWSAVIADMLVRRLLLISVCP
jgi:hypothetical protein